MTREERMQKAVAAITARLEKNKVPEKKPERAKRAPKAPVEETAAE